MEIDHSNELFDHPVTTLVFSTGMHLYSLVPDPDHVSEARGEGKSYTTLAERYAIFFPLLFLRRPLVVSNAMIRSAKEIYWGFFFFRFPLFDETPGSPVMRESPGLIYC